MVVDERRRRALHRAAATSWGEEVADTLVEGLTEERWDRRFTALEGRLDAMEHRLTATFERRIADAVSMQTRTLVLSQLGALVVIAGLAFGLR